MPALSNLAFEQYAQRLAKGEDRLQAFNEVWPNTAAREATRRKQANNLATKDFIKRRIDEINAGAVEKIQKQYVYDLDQALKDIDGVIAFARAMLQPSVELRAIELKGKFSKMLGSASESRTGTALDALTTEDLLEMQQILKERKQLRGRGETSGGSVVKMVK